MKKRKGKQRKKEGRQRKRNERKKERKERGREEKESVEASSLYKKESGRLPNSATIPCHSLLLFN